MTDDKNSPSVTDDVASILAELEAEIAEEQYVLEESDIQKGYRLLCCTTVSKPAVFLTHQVDEI